MSGQQFLQNKIVNCPTGPQGYTLTLKVENASEAMSKEDTSTYRKKL